MKNSDKRQATSDKTNGFTLVEVMLGVSVLAITLSALLGGIAGQAFLNTHARAMTAAMNDATRIMEQIRRQNQRSQPYTLCRVAGIPAVAPPSGVQSWDAWLNALPTDSPAGGGPKSIDQPDRNQFELVAVTCQDGTVATCQPGSIVRCLDETTELTCPARGAEPVRCPDGTGFAPVAPYCGSYGGSAAQVGSAEWMSDRTQATTFNPIRVTVAIGWRQQQRGIGAGDAGTEFTYTQPISGCAGPDGNTYDIPERLLVGPDRDQDGVIESQAMLTTLVTCR